MTPPVLSLDRVHKSFGGITAIEEFSLDLAAGEVVALVGDNGAGKSTLVKMIAGAHKPTSGRILIDGEEVSFADASQSQSKGIQVVYQDLALADSQSVYMNLFLGRELTRGPFRRLDRPRMIRETEKLVEALDVRIPSARSVIRDLSGGQRQGIAIARATHWATKLVLMDEPTAALGVKESALVLDLIRKLKADGRTVILISHNMRDVVALADRVVIMGAGRKYVDRPLGDLQPDDIAHMIMAGNAKAA